MAYACKFCIIKNGLDGSEVSKLPSSWEEAAEHIERVHRYPVRREGESQDDAEHRVFLKYMVPLWNAAQAVEQILGGSNLLAAQIIECSGPIIQVFAALRNCRDG